MKVQDDILNEWTDKPKPIYSSNFFKVGSKKLGAKSENIYCYAKWLPWGLCSNHLGQEIKRHKSILYGDFMHLSIDNMKY